MVHKNLYIAMTALEYNIDFLINPHQRYLSIEIATVIKMVPHSPTLRKGRIRCWGVVGQKITLERHLVRFPDPLVGWGT